MSEWKEAVRWCWISFNPGSAARGRKALPIGKFGSSRSGPSGHGTEEEATD